MRINLKICWSFGDKDALFLLGLAKLLKECLELPASTLRNEANTKRRVQGKGHP